MSAFSRDHRLAPADSALGWLTTGVELMVTDRLPCATAQAASVTAWFITTEPVRALITTFAAGAARSHVQVLDVGHEATRARSGDGRHAHAHHAAVERLRDAVAHAWR